MEKISVICPKCGNRLQIPVKLNSSKVRCKCGEITDIPETETEKEQLHQTNYIVKAGNTRTFPMLDHENLSQQTHPTSHTAAAEKSKTGIIFALLAAGAALVAGLLYFSSKKQPPQPVRPVPVNAAPAPVAPAPQKPPPAAPVQIKPVQPVPKPVPKANAVQSPAQPLKTVQHKVEPKKPPTPKKKTTKSKSKK